MRHAAATAFGHFGLLAVVALLLLGGPGLPAAYADDPPAESAAADAASGAEEPLTPQALAERFGKDPVARWTLLLLRIVPAVLGVAILILAYRRWSRGQTGTLPAIAPPPSTAPFELMPAVLLYAGAIFAAVLMGKALLALRPEWEGSTVLALVLQAAVTIPLAAIIVLRRLRVKATPHLGWRVASLRGLQGFLVGAAVASGLSFLWGGLLTAIGKPPDLYELVKRALDPEQSNLLWLVGGFAVTVAPVVEEIIFRGMLQPALRDFAGGTRRARWASIVVVAAIFAATHNHIPSVVPLWGLAVVLGVLFELTDSLRTVILAHALFNLTSIVPLMVARAQGIL